MVERCGEAGLFSVGSPVIAWPESVLHSMGNSLPSISNDATSAPACVVRIRVWHSIFFPPPCNGYYALMYGASSGIVEEEPRQFKR